MSKNGIERGMFPNAQQKAHQLAAEMCPNPNLVTRKQIAEIQSERRGRSRIIQSLQERLPKVSGEEHKILTNQLKDLQVHQGAANIVIKRFHRGR